MKITSVTGTIQALDEFRKLRDSKTYDYISIRDDSGQDVMARKVGVPDSVDRLLNAGSHGTYIFGKIALTGNALHAVRTQGGEAFSDWLQGKMAKDYRGLSLILILGLLLSFIYIGIPLVIYIVYVMVKLPSWKRLVIETAKANGFQLLKTKEI